MIWQHKKAVPGLKCLQYVFRWHCKRQKKAKEKAQSEVRKYKNMGCWMLKAYVILVLFFFVI